MLPVGRTVRQYCEALTTPEEICELLWLITVNRLTVASLRNAQRESHYPTVESTDRGRGLSVFFAPGSRNLALRRKRQKSTALKLDRASYLSLARSLCRGKQSKINYKLKRISKIARLPSPDVADDAK